MPDKVFTMRIDEKLLDKIRISAETNKRSIAKEIEYVLEQYYTDCSPKIGFNSSEVDALMTRFVELINEHGCISGKINKNTDK